MNNFYSFLLLGLSVGMFYVAYSKRWDWVEKWRILVLLFLLVISVKLSMIDNLLEASTIIDE